MLRTFSRIALVFHGHCALNRQYNESSKGGAMNRSMVRITGTILSNVVPSSPVTVILRFRIFPITNQGNIPKAF